MTFFLVGRKQCDVLRFWIYIVGSSLEAKHYSYTLTVKSNAGDKIYNHQGKVFTLDLDEVATGYDFFYLRKFGFVKKKRICIFDGFVLFCNL